jgi:hypothetical protein
MENVISRYTNQQAENDGILFNIVSVNAAWKRGIFSHVTNNLMHEGYLEENGKVRIVNLLDLLNQCNEIVKKATNGFKDFDSFFSGNIEMPSGQKQKVFIGLNDLNKFTIMLPEDY